MQKQAFKNHLYEIIFEADTKAGKAFDIGLLAVILISIASVMLESVQSISKQYGSFLHSMEWAITIIFTLEYLLRIWVVRKPWSYIFSFYGIVDLLSVLPSYLAILIAGSHSLMVIRALRLLRVFRILKISRFINESGALAQALKASRTKIFVFLFSVLMIVIVIGTIMYLIEGEASGFTSIPRSVYWAIVTITTVGYGDIAPQTALGQFFASMTMILGYAIIAVPTGIVSAEITRQNRPVKNTQVCPNCMAEDHDEDSIFCKKCGSRLND